MVLALTMTWSPITRIATSFIIYLDAWANKMIGHRINRLDVPPSNLIEVNTTPSEPSTSLRQEESLDTAGEDRAKGASK